ncbi:MarR family winged helix-turn-helix transcriptional regulator [Mycoplasma sp. P36-A1]|uniref:MarR family winged helix-turn-helix transcriptional regulator n=1 Tax=Mycoplasma sp. P36-A1 TaxID=3252900 RepID=UPI003C303B0A
MNNLTDNLMKQLRYVSEASNRLMFKKKQRLTGQQRVLAILKMEDGIDQSHLAEVLDIRKSSLAELLKKLELSEDITRVEDEQDKRSKLVYLTEKGLNTAKEITSKKSSSYSESFFKGLNEVELQQFSITLDKIVDGWDEEFKNEAKQFIDPIDRLKAMQQMRENYMKEYDENYENMSASEKREFRKKMKKVMRENHPHHSHPHPHPHHNNHSFNNQHEFSRTMNQDFMKDMFKKDDKKEDKE